jgi:hypothetical protein
MGARGNQYKYVKTKKAKLLSGAGWIERERERDGCHHGLDNG